jgi:hypothetical protein
VKLESRLFISLLGVGLIAGALQAYGHAGWTFWGLFCAGVVVLTLSLLFWPKQSARQSTASIVPANALTSGVDLAWNVCTRMLDYQLDYIEKLDVKLGIVVAGLIGAAGVFLDRAQGLLAAGLGCVALVGLICAVLGFLFGGYQDAPDPRQAVRSSDKPAAAKKAELLDSFIDSFEANELVISRKGRLLHLAAIITSAVVIVAVVAKLCAVILSSSAPPNSKAPSPLTTPKKAGRTVHLVLPRIRHTLTNKN